MLQKFVPMVSIWLIGHVLQMRAVGLEVVMHAIYVYFFLHKKGYISLYVAYLRSAFYIVFV